MWATLTIMVCHFIDWVQTLTMPVALGQVLTTSVEMCGTWTAAAPKTAEGGWFSPLSSDGQTTVLSVGLDPSLRPALVRSMGLVF